MDLNSIIDNYLNGEPIFIDEIPCKSKNYLRQELKRYTDNGILVRLYNGVYYKRYKTILGTEGKVSIDKYLDKVYLNNFKNGFYSGLTLANMYGFTTQNPAVIEVTSNKATTKQRKQNIEGYTIIIYKPICKINDENLSSLQFLELMKDINKYSELEGEEYKSKLRDFIIKTNVNFNCVKEYISLYPPIVYKNIYEGGLMNELL